MSTTTLAGGSKIVVKYGKHTYGCNNQAEYDKVMQIVEECKARADYDTESTDKNGVWEAYKRVKNGNGTEEDNIVVNSVFIDNFGPLGNVSESQIKQVAKMYLTSGYVMDYTKDTGSTNGESAYTKLVEGRGDCNASSYTDQAVYDSWGINTRVMANTTHAWCEVKIGDKWYNTDGGLGISDKPGRVWTEETFQK